LVLVCFPLPTTTPKYHPTLIRGLLNLTMCQEMIAVGHVDPVYWTLQLELCFYFLMFILFAIKELARVEFYLLGVLIISDLLQRYTPFLEHHGVPGIPLTDLKLLTVCGPGTDSHCHIHVFLIGIVLYKLTRNFSWRHLGVLAVCLLYSAFADGGMQLEFVNGQTMPIHFSPPNIDFWLTAAFTAIVYAAARDWLRVLENPATLFLGTISYSLYLTHQNIGYEIIRFLEHHGQNPNAAILVAGTISLVIASAMAFLIEQPALRRLRGKKTPAPPEQRGFPVHVGTRR
jgi:peptidoglycan/LPS O-acetylase OafA/YrhL